MAKQISRPFFLGVPPMKRDEKYRVPVPAEYKKMLMRIFGQKPQELAAITEKNGKYISIYPLAGNFLQILDKRPQYASAFNYLSVSKDGRIQLTKDLREQLTKEFNQETHVQLVGRLNHFEIWPDVTWKTEDRENTVYKEALASLDGLNTYSP